MASELWSRATELCDHSKNASLYGRRSISRLQALRSWWMRLQYASAIASGFSNGSFADGFYVLRTFGVSITPPTMTWATWMPFGHSSTASDCARPRTANFALLNATAPPRPRTEEVAPVKTMAPAPSLTMSGTASRAQRNAPRPRRAMIARIGPVWFSLGPPRPNRSRAQSEFPPGRAAAGLCENLRRLVLYRKRPQELPVHPLQVQRRVRR